MTEGTNTAVELAAARANLVEHYEGLCRYYKIEEGTRVYFPEYMYNEWYTPDGIHREVCTGLNDKNKPIWMPKEDAPAPARAFDRDVSQKSLWQENPTAEAPPFDYIPPAYNSDTQSGGPANFDGEAGGDDNPRNPLLEGEVPDQYKQEVEFYREKLIALEAKTAEQALKTAKQLKALEAKVTKPKKSSAKKPESKPDTGEGALKDLIDGKSK